MAVLTVYSSKTPLQRPVESELLPWTGPRWQIANNKQTRTDGQLHPPTTPRRCTPFHHMLQLCVRRYRMPAWVQVASRWILYLEGVAES